MQITTGERILRPIGTKQRITNLDILRGFALLGILLMTMGAFALPERFFETILQQPESINYNVAFFNTIFFEAKMRALFSMIFGAGIILFCYREKACRSVTNIFYRRMILLVMFGLIHSHVLLFAGEILFLYGLCGMFLFFFRNMKPVWLLLGAVSFIAVAMTMNTHFYNNQRSARMAYLEVKKVEKMGIPLTDEQINVSVEWKKKEKDFFPDQLKIAKNIAMMRSGYWTVAEKLRPRIITLQTKYAPFLMIELLAFMLLGMALFKWGFFSGLFHRRIYIWSLIIGYGIGFPLVLYSWNNVVEIPNDLEFIEANPYNIGIYIYQVQAILLAVGHISLVILLVQAGVFRRVTNALEAVGRMAFSNYILHTLICTFIFYGYGLGYFARLQYYELLYIVFAIWIVQLIISPIWLTYFRFGPLEWAWRSLTYWQRQPMRVRRVEPDLRTVA